MINLIDQNNPSDFCICFFYGSVSCWDCETLFSKGGLPSQLLSLFKYNCKEKELDSDEQVWTIYSVI